MEIYTSRIATLHGDCKMLQCPSWDNCSVSSCNNYVTNKLLLHRQLQLAPNNSSGFTTNNTSVSGSSLSSTLMKRESLKQFLSDNM